MKPYTEEELNNLKKIAEKNERLEEFLSHKRKKWMDLINPLFSVIRYNPSANPSTEKILNSQADALTFKQEINEEINSFINKRNKEVARVKMLKQEKLLFYATNFGLKTNVSEKGILINGHLSEHERTIDIFDGHIDYLRDTIKNLESFGYSIKNMIELMNFLNTR